MCNCADMPDMHCTGTDRPDMPDMPAMPARQTCQPDRPVVEKDFYFLFFLETRQDPCSMDGSSRVCVATA